MDAARKLLMRLGVVRLVVLEDFDGELSLRVKRRALDGGYRAYRLGLGFAEVRLRTDGTCLGEPWVKRWFDYPMKPAPTDQEQD